MTTHANTVWEAEARHAKTSALVREIDRQLASLRLPSSAIAAFLRAPERDDFWWNELARSAQLIGKGGRVLTPSAITRDCVILEFEARAETELSDAVDGAFDSLATDAAWEQT